MRTRERKRLLDKVKADVKGWRSLLTRHSRRGLKGITTKIALDRELRRKVCSEDEDGGLSQQLDHGFGLIRSVGRSSCGLCGIRGIIFAH